MDDLIALRAILYLAAAVTSTASLTSFYQNGAGSQFGGFAGSSTCISINWQLLQTFFTTNIHKQTVLHGSNVQMTYFQNEIIGGVGLTTKQKMLWKIWETQCN